jgi:hypothetical protein
MNRIGVKIDLDTGDLVSGAGTARRVIDDLTNKAKELRKEGKHAEAALLELEGSRLQGRAPGLERDIKTLYNDSRLQTTLPNGTTVLKVDQEYANIIKNNSETMEKLGDKFQEATRTGDVGKIRELIPQIERQQYESQKTIRDIINTGGDFSKRQAANNAPISGGLPQGYDWRELKGISGAISQAHDTDNWEQVARLGNTKDTLRGIMGEYDRDSKLEAKIKADPEFASQLKEIRDALKGTIAAIDEAAANGEYEKAEQLAGQAKQLQGISHKTVQDAVAPAGRAGQAGQNALLHAISLQQITGAVNTGIQTYVAQLDRSGIVNARGSGDVIGAEIEELRREAARESGIGGGVGSIVGGVAGGLLSLIPGLQALAPFLISGGSTLGGFAGNLLGIDETIKANEMATSEAYSKLWERQAPAAMELTAMFGKYDGTDAENSNSIRRTFENAANTATRYGFSPEEGMEQVKQAAYQGLYEPQALEAARDVFAFERGTGADRGALSEFRNRTGRFGISDGLNTAYQGLQASGMNPAQFNEFLRSMQKSFEDGISKGFVRGTDEIAGNLAFLSKLNGGSELWKGEQGANRLAQMNSGLEATTALSSVSDILSFRGAQNVLKQWDNAGMTLDSEGRLVSVADENWRKIGDLDPEKEGIELRRGYDYVDSMVMLERGLTPELFHSQMQMIEGAEGPGNRTGAVEQMKNIYGLNYTGSAALYQSYQDKIKTFGGDKKAADEYFSGGEWKEFIEGFKNNPDNNGSTELTMFRYVEDIRKYTLDISQWHMDQKMPEIADALKVAWLEAYEKGNTNDPNAGQHPGDPPKKEEPVVPTTPTTNPFPEEPTVEQARAGFEEALRNDVAGDEDDARRNYYDSVESDMQRRDRQEDVNRMLKKDSIKLWERNRATFFTDTPDGFGKDDPDEAAYKNLQSFGNAPEGSDSYNNYLKSIDVLKTFTDAEREYVNKNNSINTAVNDAMTDRTGQRLVELLTELRDNTREIHIEENP